MKRKIKRMIEHLHGVTQSQLRKQGPHVIQRQSGEEAKGSDVNKSKQTDNTQAIVLRRQPTKSRTGTTSTHQKVHKTECQLTSRSNAEFRSFSTTKRSSSLRRPLRCTCDET